MPPDNVFPDRFVNVVTDIVAPGWIPTIPIGPDATVSWGTATVPASATSQPASANGAPIDTMPLVADGAWSTSIPPSFTIEPLVVSNVPASPPANHSVARSAMYRLPIPTTDWVTKTRYGAPRSGRQAEAASKGTPAVQFAKSDQSPSWGLAHDVVHPLGAADAADADDVPIAASPLNASIAVAIRETSALRITHLQVSVGPRLRLRRRSHISHP